MNGSDDNLDSSSGNGKKLIVGAGIILVALTILAVLFLMVIKVLFGGSDTNSTDSSATDLTENITFSLTTDKESYNYGETVTIRATATNISSKSETVNADQNCADPLLLVNETKLESPQCQINQQEVRLDQGKSISWQWQYEILEPTADITSSNKISLTTGSHTLSARWLGDKQESISFTVDR
jgi:hypothetical protein